MSILTLLKDAVGAGEVQPPPLHVSAPAIAPTQTNDDAEQPTAGDIDTEKQAANAQVSTETGVAGIEAAQAIWGKKGRWLIIAGFVNTRFFPRDTSLY